MQETQTIDGTYVEQHAVNLWFNDWNAVTGIKRIILTIPIAQWGGSSDESYWRTVQYRTGSVTGPVVATGQFGYNKGSSVVYVIAFFDDGITGTGASRMYITTSSGSIYPDVIKTSKVLIGAPGSSADVYMISDHTGDPLPLNGENCVYYGYEFYNEYEYTQTSNQRLFNLTRDASNKSKLYIDDNGSNNLLTETSLKSDNLPFVWQITENNTWSLTLENEYGDIFYRDITYTTPEEATGTIDLSVTTYIKPDIVMADISLENADFTNNNYYAVLQNSSGGWHSFGTWKPIDSYADMLVVWDSIYTGETLPMTIRGALYEYDLNTEAYEMIAYSDSSTYVEPPPEVTGSVWTDKESYNVTEIVTIYTDTVDGGYLMIDKRNDPLHDSYTIYSGLSHVKFSLQTSHVGTWDVYLYENSVITNSTVFTVLADNDTAYFSWWGDVQKGEAAFYDYVATSSNSVITIYDGVGEKQYSFNATPGYNEGQISTMPGEAGNWTGSLYDSGVYYNSSLEVYASESWIRFVDDGYYLGDTIEIEYFIVEDWCKIRLKDGLCQYGGRSTILTWMPGSFHTGQRGTLEFTLSDDNEFGLQVETNLESGYYLPGEWRVEALFETEKGYEFVDDTTYVYDTTKGDGDDPAAVSNEMIGIFFSPQGIFLMFVVIITVMGLAVTKQPAGGAVCAVVGVGFGRFFNVLPTWMLLLTIIALVAFAGVSTAIYIKGR